MNRNTLKRTTLHRIVFLLAALLFSGALFAAEGTATGLSPIDGFAALFIFMLAAFTGHEIIGKVPVILHTPLMSGSNFVHGIVLVGAMVALGHADSMFGKVLGFIGVLLGAGNAAGGYVVTERMLDMFKSSKKPGAK
jgi:H+-translocating NAD(P) transhydrogenase subunit alpha